MSIEQPVYAGLPVWLYVDVDEPCIGVHYHGDLGGGADGGSAEVTGPGTTQKRIFQETFYASSGFDDPIGACPSYGPVDQDGTHRIPLHLVTNLRVPGLYAVRWVVPKTDELGAVKPTKWLRFVVRPSTSEQRDAWLTALVAHTPVDGNEAQETYVPSLLAAFDEPKAMHRLLDLLCFPDRRISGSVTSVFGPILPLESQTYLAKLISGGCLTEALEIYINQNINGLAFGPQMPEQQRFKILKATIAALPRANGTDLAHAIGIISRLKKTQHGALAKAADTAVLSALPKILARDDTAVGSDDQPQRLFVEYISGLGTPATDALLKKLAAQNNPAADYAIFELISSHDPADVPFLRNRLMQSVTGFSVSSLTNDITDIPMFFGQPGTSLLVSLLGAKTPHVRTVAAMTLASDGEHAGMEAIVQTLQGDSADDQIEILDKYVGTEACPPDQDGCDVSISRTSDINEPWALQQKAAMIHYFQIKLANGPASHKG